MAFKERLDVTSFTPDADADAQQGPNIRLWYVNTQISIL